jgi:uncharacterized RDD family membrane protein YckC
VCGRSLAARDGALQAMPYFPEETVTTTSGYASFWWRFLSLLIDSIILAIVGAIIGSAGSLSTTSRVILAIALAFAYATLLIGFKSQTLGMMVTKLHVEGVDGTKVTLNQAAIRSAFYSALLVIPDLHRSGKRYAHPTAAQARREVHSLGIQFLLTLPLIVDCLWMLWDKKKQTVHDKVAKTVVRR